MHYWYVKNKKKQITHSFPLNYCARHIVISLTYLVMPKLIMPELFPVGNKLLHFLSCRNIN